MAVRRDARLGCLLPDIVPFRSPASTESILKEFSCQHNVVYRTRNPGAPLPPYFRYNDSAINSPGMRPSPPDELRLLGKGIKQLRRKHRWTQQELAKRCNIHYQFLGGIEIGRASCRE